MEAEVGVGCLSSSSGRREARSNVGVEGGVRGRASSGTSRSLSGGMSGVDGMAGDGAEDEVEADELDSRRDEKGGVAGALSEAVCPWPWAWK